MSHGLSDYLDGYEEFLDNHDRRALGMAVRTQAETRAATYRGPTYTAQPQQYAVVQPAPQRLQAQLIARGRAIAVPFGLQAPTALSPGAAPTGSPAEMPMTRVVTAPPPTLNPTSYGPASVPAGGGGGSTVNPNYTDTPYQGPPSGGSSSASGGSGLFAPSVLGWGLLLGGAWWMWRSL